MGRMGIFRGQRQPLGQISTNSNGTESTDNSGKKGWRLPPHSSTKKSVHQDSESEVSVVTDSTAPSSLEKGEESLRRWLAAKARPARGSFFSSSVYHHKERPARTAAPQPAAAPVENVVAANKPKSSVSAGRSSVTPTTQQLSLGSNERLVILTVDPSWSAHSVLSQVCGGPLERIRRSGHSLELCFLHSACAQRFYFYTRSGQFVVRGQFLEASCPQDVSLFSAPSEDLRNDPDYRDAILHGARRTISIHTFVGGADRRLTASRVTVRELKAIFESVGTVLNIRPMFARKSVAYAIQYEDVLSAIRAKNAFDHGLAPFSSLGSWTANFVKDSTERPCVFA